MWNNFKEKVLMGAQENKLQIVSHKMKSLITHDDFPVCFFSIPMKFEIYFLGLP